MLKLPPDISRKVWRSCISSAPAGPNAQGPTVLAQNDIYHFEQSSFFHS